MEFLLKLEDILKDRKTNLPDKSYTAELFKAGVDRILKKIGEEAGEVIVAAKNPDQNELIHELADLLFHMQVLVVNRNLSIKDVMDELEARHN